MTDANITTINQKLKEAEQQKDEAIKAKLEAEDKVATLRQALQYYTSSKWIHGSPEAPIIEDDGDVARKALGKVIHNDEFYTRLEIAENENASFHILIRPLLEELKLCGWEEDYAITMLNQIIAYSERVDSDNPTIADIAAIHTLYASKLESLCRDIADIADSTGMNTVNLNMAILLAYESSYNYIMSQHKNYMLLKKLAESQE